jgi:predicted ribosomally synthesized peptide with nif11-like leader
MPNENITKFSEAVAASPELQSKVQSIHAQAAREAAQEIASLASANGTPFTAEEFLAGATAKAEELSDEQLETVAGGRTSTEMKIMLSIISAGLVCAGMAIESKVELGDAARCI